jgi:dipeptidyl aminopeptidase/acylaminoacyl peptidase
MSRRMESRKISTGEFDLVEPDREMPDRDVRSSRARIVIAALLIVCFVGSIRALVPGRATPSAETTQPVGLGVFEPLKGRIVYVADGELRAVDPADPGAVVTLAISGPAMDPDWHSAARLTAVGWSKDGSTLALDNEYTGQSYLMDHTGTVTRVPWGGVRGAQSACCWFVSSNWLSPDGTLAAKMGRRSVSIVDLERNVVISNAGLGESEFPVGTDIDLYGPAWSPDGSKIAFIAGYVGDESLQPTVQMMELETDAIRELVGPNFGHVRQLNWSPDGSTLLVIAGPLSLPAPAGLESPLTVPVATNIYLVGGDGSGPRSIAEGHFVAAAWSPAGNQIAAVDYPGAHELVLMNANGSEQQVIARLDSGSAGLFTGVTWHPGP